MKMIATSNAPGAIGPYSQGCEANGFVFTSGQIAIIPDTGEIAEGIQAQVNIPVRKIPSISSTSPSQPAVWE